MSSVLVYHPVGLGDHIACSGIVREYAKTHERVGLFCVEQNYPSVSHLYRDLSQVKIHAVRSHNDVRRFRILNTLQLSSHHYDRVVVVRSFDEESGIQYEKQFYHSASLPLKKMWDNFFVERNAESEKILWEKAKLNEPFVFVHDDARFPLPAERLPKLPLFRPDLSLTKDIFDYCEVLEKAQEIHVVDSSFMFLIDCLEYTNPAQKLFVHRYARPNMPWNLPILQKNWTILH